jgi:preprotein translocase subunit SecD
LKNLSWRAVSVIAVIIIAVIYILPTIKPSLWPHKKINLGLDLQGGMHLALEVDTEKAVESTIERISQEIRSLLKKEHIHPIELNRIDGSRISVELQGQENIDKFEKLLNKEFKNLRILSRSTHDGILTMMLDLPDKESAHIKKLATEQALETIRNRIDQFGVSEPDIRRQGEKRILIQLPGIKDTKRAKDLIGRTALLEFKLLDETHDLNAALQGNVPPGSVVLFGIKEDR